MADPDPVPTLFLLTLSSLIEHVKNRKVKNFTSDQIPNPIHKMLWNESSALDLITNTCHPETRDWFSNRIIKPPIMSVKFTESPLGLLDACKISIHFENRRPIEWQLKSTEWTDRRTGPVVVIRTGNQHLSTVIHNPERTIISSVPHYDRSKFEVVNWLCKVFRCGIHELEVNDDDDQAMVNWPMLRQANSLRMRKVDTYQDRMVELITVRQEKNLRTIIDTIDFPRPLGPETLRFVEFKEAHVNLSKLLISQLAEVFKEISIRTVCCYVDAKTKNFTDDHLPIFQLDLDLIEDERKLNEEFQRITSDLWELNAPFFSHMPGYTGSIPSDSDNYRQFYIVKNKTLAVVFWFIKGDFGYYDRVVMSHYEKKNDPLARAMRAPELLPLPQPIDFGNLFL